MGSMRVIFCSSLARTWSFWASSWAVSTVGLAGVVSRKISAVSRFLAAVFNSR